MSSFEDFSRDIKKSRLCHELVSVTLLLNLLIIFILEILKKEATKILSSSDKKKTGTAKLEILYYLNWFEVRKNG